MHRRILALLLVLAAPAAAQQRVPVYRDPARSADARTQDLLRRMTREEKFWQLFMIPGTPFDSNTDYTHGIFGLQVERADAGFIDSIQRYFVDRTRLGIPVIPFEEAVHGLARPGATVFPQAIALAATWDTALMTRVAEAIARETRSRGIRQVLSPVVNLATDVRWGRTEETYGEDPWLASRMAEAFVGAFERNGVVATPKHFVANVGEGGRDSYPIGLDERTLRELYFPPFLASIRAGARSIMTAYNSVNGEPATQNHWLLTDVLRRDWGFRGFVISDAAATGGATVLHMTEPDARTAARHAWVSGLDVVFQSSWPQHRPYRDAALAATLPAGILDSAVARVLRVKFALGLFDHPYTTAADAIDSAALASHRALARDAARAGIVLLRNAANTLPLGASAHRVAVIGADAAEGRTGGYSGAGLRPVTILDGIRARAHGAEVTYAPGPGRITRDVVPVPTAQLSSDSGAGLSAEYFDNIDLSGSPVLRRTDRQVDFGWTLSGPARGIARDWYSVRWTGRITAPAGGVHRLGVEGSDGWRLYLDGRLVLDDWIKRSSRRLLADVALDAGSTHDLRLEFFETTGNAHVRLVWDGGVRDSSAAAIDSAVALARASDVAIVVAGIEEGEFRDRAFLGLPGHQSEMIERVAATGTPVIVVLVGGSAVTMPWLERVAAVVDAWYPGEAGEAVADVLFGDADPAGRLPITFPVAEGQLPLRYNHTPTGRGDDYLDLTGQPLFPFGFGLSYTTFAYSNLRIEPAIIGPDGTARVTCTVTNTGARAGDEVVQLYVRDELASVARPVIALKGFRRIALAPGASEDVTFVLGKDALQLLDARMRWVVEPGTFRILVGGSSRDIRLRGALEVRP